MAKVTTSSRGIGEMLGADFMAAAMLAEAGKVKTRAEATAPFDEKSADGTHYRDSFSVAPHPRRDRAGARVSNDDEAALWVEVGSRNNAAHHTLRRALDAVGER